MNIREGKAKFKNVRILLYTVCIYTILLGIIVQKPGPKKDAVMQWHMQSGTITTNLNAEVEFTLPEFSTTNAVTWKCHMGDYAMCRDNMILRREILTQ